MLPYKKYIAGKNIIIAVDIAVNQTGIAIMLENLSVVHTEVLTLKPSWDYYRKLGDIMVFFKQLFSNVIDCDPGKIDLVLEGRLRSGFSGATLASIEGARVTVYHAFNLTVGANEKYEVNVSVYSPDLVKTYITGRGNASKSAMYAAALSRYSSLKKIKFQEDIYDAIYLGVYHLASDKPAPKPKVKRKRKTTAKRKTAVARKVRKRYSTSLKVDLWKNDVEY